MQTISLTMLTNDAVAWGSNFWAEHGQSIWLETRDAALLFDTGASEAVLEHNLRLSKKNPADLGDIVLSHAHYDHTGAVEWAAQAAPRARIWCAPEIFRPKIIRRGEQFESIGLPQNEAQLRRLGPLRFSDRPEAVLPGVILSGPIPRVYAQEAPDPKNLTIEEGQVCVDAFPDDRALYAVTPQGTLVITGCCHAGLINTIEHAARLTGAPVTAVVGGNHLVQAAPERLDWTFENLRRLGVRRFYLSHCTGLETFARFRAAFGEGAQYFGAGASLELGEG